MKRDEKLSLPQNWEKILEQMMLKRPIGMRCESVYICSPLRADTPDDVIKNMTAARVYMFYAYQYFPGVPKAPHAYLPILLNDIYEDERALALRFGKRFLKSCDKLFVCGDRLSEGMYGEITAAVKLNIPVDVFNHKTYMELCGCLARDGIDPDVLRYEDGHLHFALSWGADELAPYWGGDNDA
jgi:hypothetical protein